MPSHLDSKRYTRIKRLLSILSFALSAAFLLVLLCAGLSVRLREWVASWTPNPLLLVLGYLLVLSVLNEMLHLPVALASGHGVERHFSLSNQTLSHWFLDHLKEFILSLLLGVGAGELVYFALRRFPEHWWWMCAGAFTLFAIVLTHLAPVLLFPLFYRFEPLENEALKNRLIALCERMNTHVRGVYNWKISEKSNKANAALAGLGRTRRIILADTLLKDFSEDEIEVILAHEVGHHVHNDIWKNIAAQTLFTFVVFFLLSKLLARLTPMFGFLSISDVANLPLLMLLSMGFSILTVPLASVFSRGRERAADRFALDATRRVDAFISSMEKLGEKNLAERQPNRWIEFVFHSHPCIARRIAAAQAWAQESNHRNISNASSPVG
jgi:STE24 endopeptidase